MTETATSNSKGRVALNSPAAILRGLIAIFLGIQIVAFVSLALVNFGGWSGLLSLAAGVIIGIYGRNRLWLLFVLVFVAYIMGSFYSRNKIDKFCNSITSATLPSELSELAKRAQVEFKSGSMRDKQGMFYGYSSDYFSMGDYGCRMEFDSSHIASHKIYMD